MSDDTGDPTPETWEGGDRVARWVRRADTLEVQLAPVSDELFAAARLAPGERVLDVGCGTGPTTLRAAVAVGPTGAVTGLDLAAEMLAAAAAEPVPAGAAPIEWVRHDVVEWSPAPEFDVVLSRFGVMFFSDPVRAFTNLAAATRPGGRLAIATWDRRDESALFAVPLMPALGVTGRDLAEFADDEGPFSLPDHETIAGVLEPAGWTDLRVETVRLDLPFGGRLGPAEAAELSLDFGPTRVVTADVDDDTRARVVEAVTATLADHVDDDGHVILGGTVLITTAHRSR